MKRSIIKISFITSIVFIIGGCGKDFLEDKPSADIIVPSTLKDFVAILDNEAVLNRTNGLSQISSDEYYIPLLADFEALPTTERNASIWSKDIFEGQTQIHDWNLLFQAVYYANCILTELEKNSLASSSQGKNIEGWARFCRAYAFFDLAITFALAYDSSTAVEKKGIPIRTTPNIDEIVPRSNLKDTYEHIIEDLKIATKLLANTLPSFQKNRPSKASAFAALARVYLAMNNFTKAENAADSSLFYYSKLIDYNAVNQSSNTPFTGVHDEILFSSNQLPVYSRLTAASTSSTYSIDTTLFNSYDINDLRKAIYYRNNNGNMILKRGYGNPGLYPFTGLATDEVYLIKAECAARRGEIDTALSYLNALLINRYKTGTFVPVTVTNSADAISIILQERRKELVMRGVRWADIKRLNVLGENVVLTRIIGSDSYHLPPNSPRYALPIPDDEISMSGIEQNER
jgi:tetratricopeptide (TPR) repeat protein